MALDRRRRVGHRIATGSYSANTRFPSCLYASMELTSTMSTHAHEGSPGQDGQTGLSADSVPDRPPQGTFLNAGAPQVAIARGSKKCPACGDTQQSRTG